MKKTSKHFFIPHKVPKTKHKKQHTRHVFCKNYMPNFRNQAFSLKHWGTQIPDAKCLIDGCALHYWVVQWEACECRSASLPYGFKDQRKIREGKKLESMCAGLGIYYRRQTLTWNQESNKLFFSSSTHLLHLQNSKRPINFSP